MRGNFPLALVLIMLGMISSSHAQQREWNGHTYKIIRWADRLITAADVGPDTTGFRWEVARLDALRRGGHLVTITSQAEWDEIFDLWKQFAVTYPFAGWDTPLGLSSTYCMTQNQQFEWITGEPYTFPVIHRRPDDLMNSHFSLVGTPSMMYFENVQIGDPTTGFYDFYIIETDPPGDTDSDGVSDYDETVIHKSDITKVDTDGDGFSDFEEKINKTSLTTPNAESLSRTAPVTVKRAILLEVQVRSCSIYQLQESDDLIGWRNVGAPTSAVYDHLEVYIVAEDRAKYHRVIQVD